MFSIPSYFLLFFFFLSLLFSFYFKIFYFLFSLFSIFSLLLFFFLSSSTSVRIIERDRARGRRELGLDGNNNWHQSIGFRRAGRRWRSSRMAAEHGDAVRAGSAADLHGCAEAAVARCGSAERRPSSWTCRIGRVDRVGARSWRELEACGAW